MTLPGGTGLGPDEIAAKLGEIDVPFAEGIRGVGASLRKRDP